MRNILIIGAGRSATCLIRYLLEKSQSEDLFITIGDISIESAQKYIKGYPNTKGILLDVTNKEQREEVVKNSDLVISMLPAHFHIEVAKDCITFGKNLVTASYINDEMRSLDDAAKEKGLVFMNEIGVDPGIDHMSAMQVIDRIKDEGGNAGTNNIVIGLTGSDTIDGASSQTISTDYCVIALYNNNATGWFIASND